MNILNPKLTVCKCNNASAGLFLHKLQKWAINILYYNAIHAFIWHIMYTCFCVLSMCKVNAI